MRINDLLARTLGVRLVRDRYLQSAGFFAALHASRKINEEAAGALRAMELFNGKTLTPTLKRHSDEYAMEILGNPDYAPWLYVYSAMRGEFHDGWMPENFYHLVVVPRIIKGLADLTTLKSFSNLLLNSDVLPDIAYHIDGIFYDRDYRIISRAELIELAAPHGDVFVKGDGGGRGSNIRKLSAAALAEHKFAGDCALQKPILQHPFFEEFMTGALATLRITTVKTAQGAIEMRGGGLRFGRADTEWLISEKSVRVAVLDDAGTLDELGYTPDWRAWPAHPDTGARFADRRIPAFSQALELCRTLHAKQPHFAVVGWDVAINRDGAIELVEWNGGHGGITLSEAVNGPHFKDMGWERFARKTAT
jgi:Sugar-transfer associated ATP-grasp